MNIRRWLITDELEGMARYLDLVASFLADHLQRFEESVEAMASRWADEDRQGLQEAFLDEYVELREDFPRRLYSSFLVGWYSFVERELIRLCEDLDLTMTVRIGDPVRPRKGIDRARSFLDKGAGHTINDGHWNELTTIRRVRNMIVHENSVVPHTYDEPEDGSIKTVQVEIHGSLAFLPIDQHLHRYMTRHSLITFAGSRFVVDPGRDYCQHLVGFGKELILRIYEDMGIK